MFLKKLLQKILAKVAARVIKKYQPRVVAITGSVGKTSAKEAAVMAAQNLTGVKAAKKNFNNEFGVALAILGIEDYPGRNFFKWLDVFVHAIGYLMYQSKHYPKILLLEYGADKPGDIAFLCQIARPEVAVITACGTAHREFYKSNSDILKEKASLFNYLSKTAVAIVNGDDEDLLRTLSACHALNKISYGLKEDHGVRFVAMENNQNVLTCGLKGKILINDSVVPVNFENLYSQHQLYGPLAGLAIALALQVEQLQAIQNVSEYLLPVGRGRKLNGIKGSVLLDDTYNSSPEAVLAGLADIDELSSGRELVLILGDMLELGEEAIASHKKIGERVAALKPKYFIAVGDYINFSVQSALAGGLSRENIFAFAEAISAGEFIRGKLPENALVYLKGSQSVRIEKITKMLLAEPARDSHLLCRQGEKWLKSDLSS